MKVYGFAASIGPNSPWTKVAEIVVPSAERWDVKEVRLYVSIDRAAVRLLVRVGPTAETIIDTLGAMSVYLGLPYPAAFSAPGGSLIVLEAANPTAETAAIYVELLYEVAR